MTKLSTAIQRRAISDVVIPHFVVQFTLESDVDALLSVDGYLNVPLSREDRIQVEASPFKARFLRIHPPTRFFHTLTRRLDFGGAVPKPTSLGS